MAGSRRKRHRKRSPTPGLHRNMQDGACTIIVPASTSPTMIRMVKVPGKSNSIAIQSPIPLDFPKAEENSSAT